MSKDFYLSVIPIKNFNWHKFVTNIISTATIQDTGYKCMRMFETLDYIKNAGTDHLPVFIPSESITLKDNIHFRIAVSLPIDENNTKIITPWVDEPMEYDKAKWLSAEKLINCHSNCTVILYDDYQLFNEKISEEIQDYIDKLLTICKKADRPYMLINEKDYVNFESLRKYFMEG